MARKSAAELAIVHVQPRATRLRCPDDLDAKSAAMFKDVVANCPASHFAPADVHVLTAFVQAVQISRQSAGDPALIQQWEKSTRLIATLAQRLRLCPSARLDRKTATRAIERDPPLSYYDRMADEQA
jgi:phage terminase small subunit